MYRSRTAPLVTVLFLIACMVLAYRFFAAPPQAFPAPYELVVEDGDTSLEIAKRLSDADVIRSELAFRVLLRMFGTDRAISSGHYYFAEPISVLDIALRISGKQYGINRRNVTFPEGYTVSDMAKKLKAEFPQFDDGLFVQNASGLEGYLFPDTYGFLPYVTPDVVIGAMKENFQKKIEPLEREIAASNRSQSAIIIMASIIEKEADGDDDAGVISGILWKRLDRGMRLEVDAAPSTYDKGGLPARPIANPGLRSIHAALRPIPSPYLYYLHDKNGNVHYASTYEGHRENIRKHLK